MRSTMAEHQTTLHGQRFLPATDLRLRAPYRVLPQGLDEALMVFSAGRHGEILVGVAHQPPDLRVVQDGWATRFKTQPDMPQDYTLSVWHEGHRVRRVRIAGERFNVTEAQPLGDGYLLSCPRCRRESDSDIEKNGRIYDAAGRLAGEIVLGDGINCLLTTRDDEIWVGYSDEGIFGAFGWDEPLGKSGLVKWSRTGLLRYEYAPPEETSAICEVNAMTVDAVGDLWCYYYDAFRLLCVRANGRVQQWDTGIASAHTLAVSWPWVALLGDGEDNYTCHLLRLEDHGRVRVAGRFRLCTPQGAPITHGRVAAYGAKMHILHEGQVYSLDVADCLPHLP